MSWFNTCEHDYEFVRNIYGDEINACGGYRSIWKCKKCGKIEYHKNLQTFSLLQRLDNLYDEYYHNKYEEWQTLRQDTLTNITIDMLEAAKRGECWYTIVLLCDEDANDKNYYEKWFTENNIKIEEIKLFNQQEKCDKLNQYKFHVRWKYKY
jgi:hypothetical protein